MKPPVRGRVPVTVYGGRADPRALEEYQSAGVTRCVFRLPSAGADVVLPLIEQAADVVQRFG